MKEKAATDLRIEKVLFSKRKRDIKDIYISAFPKEDRMPFCMMIAMSLLWNTEFLAFYDGDTLCGLIYLATIGRQTFIMFFAVDERLRSKGYGSRILNGVRSMCKGKIIVSIEPCDDVSVGDIEDRLRRKRFYKKNGYEDSGYFLKLGGKKQEVLINGGEFSKAKFILFFMLYSNCTVIPKIWKTEQRENTEEVTK